jgi:hypothetical protein
VGADTSNPQRESSGSASRAKAKAVWITNLTQFAGLAMGINEAFLQDDPRREIVVLCVVFVMGAQAAEDIALRIIDRVLDRGDSSSS